MRDAAVIEAERDARVDGMDERALPLHPEELAAARASFDDEAFGRAGDEVRDDRIDGYPPPRDRDARLAGRDEDRAQAAPPRFEIELARDGHLPDRAIGADREDDRRVDLEVRAGRGREIRGRAAQVAQLDAALRGQR